MKRWQCLQGIRITGIISTTDRSVRATVAATGKPAEFPRFVTEFKPGMAIVPQWLARKILGPAAGSQALAGTNPDGGPDGSAEIDRVAAD